MSNYELVPFEDPAKLADAVAQAWISELQRIASRQTPFCLALSGGRIARQVFSSAAARAKSHGFRLDGVEFFWGDERCVVPTDPESNYLLANELLLKPLEIPEGRIHRVRGEEEPTFAAAQAEAEICRIAPLDPDGQPAEPGARRDDGLPLPPRR